MEEVPVPRPGPGEVLVKVNRFFWERIWFFTFCMRICECRSKSR